MEGGAVSEEGWFNAGDVRPLVVAAVMLPIMVWGLFSVARDAWRGEVVNAWTPPAWATFLIAFGGGSVIFIIGGWLLWSGLTDPMQTTQGLFAGGAHNWSTGVLGGVGMLVGMVFFELPLARYVGRKRAAVRKARRQSRRKPARGEPVKETAPGETRE